MLLAQGPLLIYIIPEPVDYRVTMRAVVLASYFLIFHGNTFSESDKTTFQDCGIRYAVNRYEPAILHGAPTVHSEYPWHIALYRKYKVNDSVEFICGGSIIHPKVILTAAHCVYDETYYSTDNATFMAVAGKYYSSWEHRDLDEQRREVINTTIPKTYLGLSNRYADDIAVLTLNESLTLSSLVMPVCIDWNSHIKVEQISTPGTVVGWGLTENGTKSPHLLVANLNYYDFTKCRDEVSYGFTDFITSDKFCAGVDNGTAVAQGDSGGALSFPRNSTENRERYYIYGIVSTKDKWRNQIAAFTDVREHITWLNRTLLSIIDPSKLEEGCLPLNSNSVSLILCTYNDTSVDCNKPAKPGTKAKLLCKSSYHTGPPVRLHYETECTKNMTWIPLLDSCIDCGKKYKFNQILPLVKYKPRKVSEYPWHIGLYRYKTAEKEHQYICGGTIIHPKAVITAAHCVFDNYRSTPLNVEELFIAAGKYKGKWTDHDYFEQRFRVMRSYLHASYNGDRSNFKDDIAILELNDTITFSDYIMPACIDWEEKLQLYKTPLISGTAPGWGITEDGQPSDQLRAGKLPFIDKKRCLSMIPESFRIFTTNDKFCAGSTDGATLDKGDSGGSLTFPRYDAETGVELNYIYGITSLRANEFEDVTLFSNVTYYVEWIKYILNNIIIND